MDTAPIVDTAFVRDVDAQHDQTNGGAHHTLSHAERPRQSNCDRDHFCAPRLHFGPYRLLPTQRLLLDHDKPVVLGSRALDILIVLVERAGELVTRDQLLARVWPNTTVVEGNLVVQIGALRRALRDGKAGNRYIVTVPGRGYCFVASVTKEDGILPGRSDGPFPRHSSGSMLGSNAYRGINTPTEIHAWPHRFVAVRHHPNIDDALRALAHKGLAHPTVDGKMWLIDLAQIDGETDLRNMVSCALTAYANGSPKLSRRSA